MKTCFKCKRTLDISKFYKHPMMADGRLGKCKDCTKLDSTKRRALKLKEVQAYDRIRYKNDTRRKRQKAYLRRMRSLFPGRTSARYKTLNAIRDGKMNRMPCAVCGSQSTEAHHPDYRSAFKIVWLCVQHHKELHRKYDYSKILSVKDGSELKMAML